MLRCGQQCTNFKLMPLLRHILPDGVLERLSFVYDRSHLLDSRNFPWSYKSISVLLRKFLSYRFTDLDQALFVDVNPKSLRLNLAYYSFFPWPFSGHLTQQSRDLVIPNVVTDISLVIYPLHRFSNVPDYMLQVLRNGQPH